MDAVALLERGLDRYYLGSSCSGTRHAIHNNSSVIRRNLADEMLMLLLVLMREWLLWHTSKCFVVIAIEESDVDCQVVVIGWIR